MLVDLPDVEHVDVPVRKVWLGCGCAQRLQLAGQRPLGALGGDGSRILDVGGNYRAEGRGNNRADGMLGRLLLLLLLFLLLGQGGELGVDLGQPVRVFEDVGRFEVLEEKG